MKSERIPRCLTYTKGWRAMPFTEMQDKKSRMGGRDGEEGHEFSLRNVDFEVYERQQSLLSL